MNDVSSESASDELITLHVVTKNVQSLKHEDRFNDFVAEIDKLDFSVLCLCETWRNDREECFLTPAGHKMFFSGGGDVGHRGVGIALSRHLCASITNVCFHATSSRICTVQFEIRTVIIKCFAVYMPMVWGSDDEVDLCYVLLDLLLDESENMNFATLLAGDFNANLGAPAPATQSNALDNTVLDRGMPVGGL